VVATAQHKSGKQRLLLSYSDGRTKVSHLTSILPRVADLIIRVAPDKLNLRFEELASAVLGQSSADSGPPRTMVQLMLAHKRVSWGSSQLLCDGNRRALSLSPCRSHQEAQKSAQYFSI